MCRKSCLNVSRRSAERPGKLDASQPPPTITKFNGDRRHASGHHGGGELGNQTVVFRQHRTVVRFEAGRQRLPLIVAEVMVGGTGGDDQIVVTCFAVAQDDAPVWHVQIHHLAPQHFRVSIALEHNAQRRGDFARRQRSRGDLIEQRLEEMKVPPVDYGYGKRRLAEVLAAYNRRIRHRR
jgi:hypothetical protein